MDGARILVLAAILIYLGAKVFQRWYDSFAIKECVSTVQGSYLFNNESVYLRQPVYYHVYEYYVDGEVYLVELNKPGKCYLGAPKIDIQYNPQDPSVCFIDGVRGRILPKRHSEGLTK